MASTCKACQEEGVAVLVALRNPLEMRLFPVLVVAFACKEPAGAAFDAGAGPAPSASVSASPAPLSSFVQGSIVADGGNPLYTAPYLIGVYARNPVAADAQFEGHDISVVGLVKAIDEESEDYVIRLGSRDAADRFSIECRLPKGGAQSKALMMHVSVGYQAFASGVVRKNTGGAIVLRVCAASMRGDGGML
jgi:tRNA_anti-like